MIKMCIKSKNSDNIDGEKRMALKRESYLCERLLISLAFAAFTAFAFSALILIRNQAIQGQLAIAQKEQAELRKRDAELESELKLRESETAKLEAALKQEKHEKENLELQVETAKSGAKVALGVLACTFLWDMTAFVGNPLAVPGLVDNAVCGVMAAAVGYVTNFPKDKLIFQGRRETDTK